MIMMASRHSPHLQREKQSSTIWGEVSHRIKMIIIISSKGEQIGNSNPWVTRPTIPEALTRSRSFRFSRPLLLAERGDGRGRILSRLQIPF